MFLWTQSVSKLPKMRMYIHQTGHDRFAFCIYDLRPIGNSDWGCLSYRQNLISVYHYCSVLNHFITIHSNDPCSGKNGFSFGLVWGQNQINFNSRGVNRWNAVRRSFHKQKAFADVFFKILITQRPTQLLAVGRPLQTNPGISGYLSYGHIFGRSIQLQYLPSHRHSSNIHFVQIGESHPMVVRTWNNALSIFRLHNLTCFFSL